MALFQIGIKGAIFIMNFKCKSKILLFITLFTLIFGAPFCNAMSSDEAHRQLEVYFERLEAAGDRRFSSSQLPSHHNADNRWAAASSSLESQRERLLNMSAYLREQNQRLDTLVEAKSGNSSSVSQKYSYKDYVENQMCSVIKGHRELVNTSFAECPLPILHRAIRLNLQRLVELLLSNGADIDRADNQGHTPLYLANACNNSAMVRILLNNRAKISDLGGEVLISAVRRGDIDSVRILLEQHVNPNCMDEQGYTPLILAVEKGYESIIKMLLENGANPNLRHGKAKVTPLCLALRGGKYNNDSEVTALLSGHGAKEGPLCDCCCLVM